MTRSQPIGLLPHHKTHERAVLDRRVEVLEQDAVVLARAVTWLELHIAPNLRAACGAQGTSTSVRGDLGRLRT
jgi:hypothetical protein